ncbi:Protein priB [Grifola frondosa]|uniref:Protein priB n=1 Tax=Grifola frondosa TaxID=5627 RepID=A0A1C7MGW3_GRIFR|nr:Protein priB [Grifola frondosa]
MFPPAYNFPDQLSTNPVRSQMQDDPYGQQTSWHALVQQQVGDLTIPQRTNSPQVSSPQSSTSSKAEGSSHLNHFSSQLSAAAQAMGWSIPADLVTRLQDQYPQHANWSSSYHADNFSLQSEQLNHIVQPQLPGTVKTEDNRTSQLSSLPNDANQHLLEPSLYSIDDNAQTNGGGCERTKPKNRQGVAKRPGACARCRRLKMKCTFASDSAEICSRCSVGGHECVFPGRKPRSPGMRMVLRQQIREKDAMIDTLLNQVNPGPVMATPLSLVPSRLPLTTEERSAYRDVLTYLERLTAQNSARFMGEGRAKFDISALEDVSEESGESDDEAPDGVTSPRRASSPRVGITHQVDTLLEASAPTGMLASASLQHSRATAKSTVESTSDGASSHNSSAEGGIASETYFLPGPSSNLELRRLIVERQAAPDILLSGLVTPDDVAKLFQIHYQWINPIIPILDENIHTPAAVLGRCPFLFTVICAVASRYYQEKPHIYGMAMHFAKAAAANAVIDGWKTIEMCQAFALWSVYNPPDGVGKTIGPGVTPVSHSDLQPS